LAARRCSAAGRAGLKAIAQRGRDNLIQVILHGIAPPHPATWLYAGLKDSLTDGQVAESPGICGGNFAPE